MIKNIFQRIPSWRQLKLLGNNKIIRSSYFWLFFVPLSAKVFENIKGTLALTVFSETVTVNIELPFSWQMFYLSSVFFALGSLIYTSFCHVGIKRYDSFIEWKETGKDESSLIKAFLNVYRHKSYMWPFSIPDSKKNYFIHHLVSYDGDHLAITKNDYQTPVKLIKSGIPEENIKAAFHFVHDIFSSSRPVYRLVCTLSYFFGFLFFSVVLIENFFYVVKSFWL